MPETLQTIQLNKRDGILMITLNRPDAYNALTETMTAELTQAFRDVAGASDIRCVVVTGAGKAFCAGEDLQGVTDDTDYAALLRARYHPMMEALKKVPQPVVAAVNGVAAGAGMSLALACDFRLAHKKSSFVSAFMNIGLVPDFGMMYTLPRLVGYAKALEITVLGQPIDGKKAVELGLITEWVEMDEWESGIEVFCEKLASLPTIAISLIKRYMMDAMNEPLDGLLEKEAEAQRVAGESADHKEGVRAFVEKRKPFFKGK